MTERNCNIFDQVDVEEIKERLAGFYLKDELTIQEQREKQRLEAVFIALEKLKFNNEKTDDLR